MKADWLPRQRNRKPRHRRKDQLMNLAATKRHEGKDPFLRTPSSAFLADLESFRIPLART